MAYSVPDTYKLDKPILQGLQNSSSTAKHPVGFRVSAEDGTEFQYVYMQSSGVTCYSGRPLVWVDTTGDYVVTPDASDAAPGKGANDCGGFAGIATMNNIDVDAAYIFMQTKGLADSVLVSAVVAVNDELIVSDENCLDDITPYHTSATSTHYKLIGKAMTAAAAGEGSLHSTASIILY